jgi:DNA-binding NarL/FixJ family response regulator
VFAGKMPACWHGILTRQGSKIFDMSTGAVWVVDSDMEDQDIVRTIWKELDLPNELVLLKNAEEAIIRLAEADRAPFIIISAVNLPGTDGFELRRQLLETHSKKFKSVPFIFWTTHATEEQVVQAYDLSVHGFFIKEGSFNDLKETFQSIIGYWLKSKMPLKTEKPFLS